MTHQLTEILALLHKAARPEDVFGPLVGDQERALRRSYHDLATAVHPDHNPGHRAAAEEAFKLLQAWYGSALRRVKSGTYGVREPLISASTKLHHYEGDAPPIQGDLADLYPALADGADAVLLKVTRHPRNNDLLSAEARALLRIDRELAGQRIREHFPRLRESFVLKDGSGVQRVTNVLRHERDFVSLAEIVAAYPRGIDAADAAWMFNRILTALANTHHLGLVHGAVIPSHILIRPGDHNGMLIDWCYSVEKGAAIKAISPTYAALYPPEVTAKQPASPATDIYLAASTLSLLLGGRGEQLPPTVPKQIRALLRACLIPAPSRRINDAWQLFDDFREILGQLYGPPKFRPFQMPAPATHIN